MAWVVPLLSIIHEIAAEKGAGRPSEYASSPYRFAITSDTPLFLTTLCHSMRHGYKGSSFQLAGIASKFGGWPGRGGANRVMSAHRTTSIRPILVKIGAGRIEAGFSVT